MSGGGYNTASGRGSTVNGGVDNTASGNYSTVSGGNGNIAGAAYSWVGGQNMKLSSSAIGTFVWGYNSTVSPPTISTSYAFLIGPSGTTYQVGINLSNPTYALQLPNNSTNDVGKARANAWVTYSDARVKTEVTTMAGQEALQKVAQLRPVHYFHHSSRWMPEGHLELLEEGEYRYGFLAQELVHVVPEAVDVPADPEKDLYSVSYSELIPILTAAIQAQQKTINQQQSQIEALTRRLSAVESQLNSHPQK